MLAVIALPVREYRKTRRIECRAYSHVAFAMASKPSGHDLLHPFRLRVYMPDHGACISIEACIRTIGGYAIP
jgi:hypothetical protein